MSKINIAIEALKGVLPPGDGSNLFVHSKTGNYSVRESGTDDWLYVCKTASFKIKAPILRQMVKYCE